MFEEWMQQATDYVMHHLDRKLFRDLEGELDADVAQVCELYVTVLRERGVIDENGEDTDVDFDEDDLLEAMLERFVSAHPCDDERELLYAALIDAVLEQIEEFDEDI